MGHLMTDAVDIRLDDLAFGYGRTADMHFDGSFEAGALTAVMGPSGSGKSTLFALIAGFEEPASGRVTIGGDDVTRKAPGERPITYVFQENNLFAHLDVSTNVGLGIAPRRRLRSEEREKVEAALGHVGLSGLGSRMPGTLSGGERQRVALARALVRRRPVLLLDEPFAALGPSLREEMLALVRALHDEGGLTTLMITHRPADARAIADRILFIEGGRIAGEGESEAMFARTDLEGWRAYLGSARED